MQNYDQNLDDTQPTRAVYDMPNLIRMEDDDEEAGGGPGCVVWALVGLFMLLLSAGTVVMALFAGWNDGYRVASDGATATGYQVIQTQCDLIPGDLTNGAFGLAQRRAESLATLTPAVECLAALAPQMTNAYTSAMQTLTPAMTPTSAPTATTETVVMPTEATPQPTSSSGYDLAALLAEAQADIAAGSNRRAIDTLDAITAVDPTYQKTLVDQLLFSALTSEARNLFRTGQNLAEAIILTTRAEQYGNIGELNYERFIAEIWLQAQANKGVNYPAAIQALRRIVYEQGLPNYRNASRELFDTMVAYADALLLGGDPCTARTQYDAALSLFNSAEVANARASAEAQCSAVPLVTPGDPNAPTPDNSGGSGGSSPIGVRP